MQTAQRQLAFDNYSNAKLLRKRFPVSYAGLRSMIHGHYAETIISKPIQEWLVLFEKSLEVFSFVWDFAVESRDHVFVKVG